MGKAGTSGTVFHCLTLVSCPFFDARKLERGKVGGEETDREIETDRQTEK